jgi:hypothetical protein
MVASAGRPSLTANSDLGSISQTRLALAKILACRPWKPPFRASRSAVASPARSESVEPPQPTSADTKTNAVAIPTPLTGRKLADRPESLPAHQFDLLECLAIRHAWSPRPDPDGSNPTGPSRIARSLAAIPRQPTVDGQPVDARRLRRAAARSTTASCRMSASGRLGRTAASTRLDLVNHAVTDARCQRQAAN